MDPVLKEYFGFSSLRAYKKEVIDKVLQGRDCLVVMATGAGKSLCYLLPPLLMNKTCVVVSPLLSLMQDQVMSLKQKGVKLDFLGSTQTNLMVTSNAQAGYYDVLYMTPERAMALPKIFWSKLVSAGICLLAVDEAHCISEWGHDFRVEYKRLHLLRLLMPGVPYVTFTATDTERRVKYGESTIIYCATIRDTKQVHEALTSFGIKAGIYHGQMDSKSRELSHKSFVTDKVLVMIATIALGMGIDKPDVRCVIHFGCPKSLESYYQESGRCGRDGLPSVCWLYYQRSDFTRGDFYCTEIKSVSALYGKFDKIVFSQYIGNSEDSYHEFLYCWAKVLHSWLLSADELTQIFWRGDITIFCIAAKGNDYIDCSIGNQPPLVFHMPPDMINEDEEEEATDDIGIEVEAEEACEQLSLSNNFINRFSVIIIHSIKEISQELDLRLDNMSLYDSDDEIDQYVSSESDQDETMPYEELKQIILSIVASQAGVSRSFIVTKCSNFEEQDVVAAIEELECPFDIYIKSGLYFLL